MLNEIIKAEEVETYTVMTLKDKIIMFSSMTFFAVIWVALMLILPLPIIIGYVTLLAAIVASLWMSPRVVDVGVEGNFVKIK